VRREWWNNAVDILAATKREREREREREMTMLTGFLLHFLFNEILAY
jgi:hypothetical protein